MNKGLIGYSLRCIERLNEKEKTKQVERLIQDHVDTIRDCVKNLVDNDEELGK